ncbi:MAG: DEAD/DEAH box helicase, partial [Anaerolineales bacterium]
MSLDYLLEEWQRNTSIRNNIVNWKKIPANPGTFHPFPDNLSPSLVDALHYLGIAYLYGHQAEAYQRAHEQQNILIVSGTASGKSLCYNLPILDNLIKQPDACALYLFPTKALAHDQAHNLSLILENIPEFQIKHKNAHHPLIGIYDGDTPQVQRQAIRRNTQLLFTNPDMLHLGILPNHPQWDRFFSRLQFIVLDEIHVYRGVFGSHVANVIRRLKRIVQHYGSQPSFILTSGTISNPDQFASQLIEEPIQIINQDSSPKGEKNIMFFNPPITNPEFGLRAHPFQIAKQLIYDLIHQKT